MSPSFTGRFFEACTHRMKRVTKQTFALYWKHVRVYRGLALVMVAAVSVGTLLHLAQPLFYREFFDILASGDAPRMQAPKLLRIIFQILGINIVGYVFYRIASFSSITFQSRVMRDIENSTFDYLHHHSVGFFINRFVGSLVRRVNRLVRSFEVMADRATWDLIPLTLQVIVVVTVLTIERPILGALMFVWVVLYVGVSYLFSLYKLKYDTAQAEVDSRVSGNLADTITNAINVKLFTAFGREYRRHGGLTDEQNRARVLAWRMDEAMHSITGFFFIILEFAVFWIAIRLWGEGKVTVGDFVLIQSYLLTIFIHMWDFGRILRNIYENLAEAEEMVEILSTPHEVQDSMRAKPLRVREGKIEYTNVQFAYTKTRDVLKDFSLAIEPGERVGLVGPSGSGKTTLTALLLRSFDVIGGAISIDGQNIAHVTQESLRAAIALVPQDPLLFHRTLYENIAYGRANATKKEVIRASRLAHCHEFIDKLPYTYETFVGERGVKLSGGERQRVAIARAILKNAPILVLDEATSSLDSHSEALIQDALVNLMKGKTTLVIAHRLSTIMKMDRIVVIQHGTIMEQGSHTELLAHGGLYKKLWDMQAGGFIA